MVLNNDLFMIIFYVPATHVEAVKTAMFNAGAGKMGPYDQVCWQCMGQGQYRPLAGSEPYLGKTDQLERCEEYKVEMICEEKFLAAVIHALKASHPYEMPAYFVTKNDYAG